MRDPHTTETFEEYEARILAERARFEAERQAPGPAPRRAVKAKRKARRTVKASRKANRR